MKAIVRTVILLAVVLWIGAVMFYPIVAADISHSIADAHTGGSIAAKIFHDLHYEGIWTGVALLFLLYAAHKFEALPRSVVPAVVVTLVLLALTVFSQGWLAPRLERARAAAMSAPGDAASHATFHTFQTASDTTQAAIGAGGIALIALLAINFPPEPRRFPPVAEQA